ncbi:MAG TPA: phosphopentomutase [Bryobacteraceae bacterium]|nr:phosphopentomutase [Bryobacteraceae bacterium]
MFTRVLLLVLDSAGIGAMPDWAAFLDPEPGDTLGHLAARRPLALPNLQRLGLANIRPLDHLAPDPAPLAAFGRCALASPGKDTTTGHWELAGILLDRPFPLYPAGFPPEIIDPFIARTGRGVLGNKTASGTEIIRELGEQHLASGDLIVYTSADSVFQIAAHEEKVPLDELYRCCEIARDLLRGKHEVGRVIARPFLGAPGAFTRTANRHDYAVPPPPGMLLDRLAEAGHPVISVGKIADVFLNRGVAASYKTKSNAEGMQRTLDALQNHPNGLIFVNLVDFDMLYGHRNDPEGYSQALEAVDLWIPDLLAALRPGDLLLVTADHGCDPTTASTDHTREYVPLLAFSPSLRHPGSLGDRASLADIGQTIADNFGLHVPGGASFLDQLR